MVNDSSSVPPAGGGSNPTSPTNPTSSTPSGEFAFTKSHTFLGMTFTAKDWNKLMNILLKNLSDYINKTFQKMTAKLKKDWARGEGKEVLD